jgi:hypothetical protein
MEITSRLMARALDAESTGRPDAMAWFDAGYFVETLKQAGLVYKYGMLNAQQKKEWALRGDTNGFDGFAWVQKALRINGESKDIRYAMTLIDVERSKKVETVASR